MARVPSSRFRRASMARAGRVMYRAWDSSEAEAASTGSPAKTEKPGWTQERSWSR